jgi:CheY-like chemotaxis protein
MTAGTTILVVDDDEDNREAIAATLQIRGFQVVLAVNGAQALGLLRGGLAPDLIILDLMMPVMDGWAFLRERRAEPAIAAIPVLVLSAVTERSGERLDADDFLAKPMELKALLGRIDKLIRKG